MAWITGRVDSMPACFFLAAFLQFVRWRADGRRRDYAWSVAWCAVALLSKQNTVILGPCLVAYDLLVRRQPPRPTWAWLRPYLPFAVLTVAYLALRYVLFGEVARESMLNAQQLRVFALDVAVHLKRMVYGEPGVAMAGARLATWVAAAAAATVLYGAWAAWPTRRLAHRRRGLLRPRLDRLVAGADAGGRIRVAAAHVPRVGRVGHPAGGAGRAAVAARGDRRALGRGGARDRGAGRLRRAAPP